MNPLVTSQITLENEIAIPNEANFLLYRQLYEISLNDTSLVKIIVGTFDKNSHLAIFPCKVYTIASIPPDFGPATFSLTSILAKFGLKNIGILGQLNLQGLIIL